MTELRFVDADPYDIDPMDIAYILIVDVKGVGRLIAGPTEPMSQADIAGHLKEVASKVAGPQETVPDVGLVLDPVSQVVFNALEAMPAITARNAQRANQKRSRIISDALTEKFTVEGK